MTTLIEVKDSRSIENGRPEDWEEDVNKEIVMESDVDITAFLEQHVPVRPMYDKLLIMPCEAEETTSGKDGVKIIIPEASRKRPPEGVVLATGEGYRNADGSISPLTIKPGDKVIYSKFGATEITIDAVDYILCEEKEIYAVRK